MQQAYYVIAEPLGEMAQSQRLQGAELRLCSLFCYADILPKKVSSHLLVKHNHNASRRAGSLPYTGELQYLHV